MATRTIGRVGASIAAIALAASAGAAALTGLTLPKPRPAVTDALRQLDRDELAGRVVQDLDGRSVIPL